MKWRDILTGWLNRHKSREFFVIQRRNICRGCSFNTKTRKAFYWRWLPAFCSICKCDIKAKTASPFVSCPLSRWGQQITQAELMEVLKKRFG